MKHWKMLLLTLALIALPLVGCAGDDADDAEMEVTETEVGDTEMTEEVPGPVADAEQMAALATLQTPDGRSLGEVRFYNEGGGVRIVADLAGVEGAGMHGFHIHENGECQPPEFQSAGGHFNPEGVEHACPPTTPRHAGDLGNIEVAEDGSASLELTSDLVSLGTGANSIIGKAVMLHSGEDDCQTQPTGDAGGRQACGVIALSNPAAEDTVMVEPEDAMEEADGEGDAM